MLASGCGAMWTRNLVQNTKDPVECQGTGPSPTPNPRPVLAYRFSRWSWRLSGTLAEDGYWPIGSIQQCCTALDVAKGLGFRTWALFCFPPKWESISCLHSCLHCQVDVLPPSESAGTEGSVTLELDSPQQVGESQEPLVQAAVLSQALLKWAWNPGETPLILLTCSLPLTDFPTWLKFSKFCLCALFLHPVWLPEPLSAPHSMFAEGAASGSWILFPPLLLQASLNFSTVTELRRPGGRKAKPWALVCHRATKRPLPFQSS